MQEAVAAAPPLEAEAAYPPAEPPVAPPQTPRPDERSVTAGVVSPPSASTPFSHAEVPLDQLMNISTSPAASEINLIFNTPLQLKTTMAISPPDNFDASPTPVAPLKPPSAANTTSEKGADGNTPSVKRASPIEQRGGSAEKRARVSHASASARSEGTELEEVFSQLPLLTALGAQAQLADKRIATATPAPGILKDLGAYEGLTSLATAGAHLLSTAETERRAGVAIESLLHSDPQSDPSAVAPISQPPPALPLPLHVPHPATPPCGPKEGHSREHTEVESEASSTSFSDIAEEVEAMTADLRAAGAGDREAQFRVGVGLAEAARPEEAVFWFRKAAEQGHALAQFNLGVCLRVGLGVVRSDREAAEWWRRAAEQGVASAQYNLGRCFADGAGVVADAASAFAWFSKAAAQNKANAMHALGRCYLKSIGTPKDLQAACLWFTRAAVLGYPRAEYALAKCYARGIGRARSDKSAIYWCERAAQQGHAKAQCTLARCLAKGAGGLRKDEGEAVKLLQQAANQGYHKAQYHLGLCYETGKGVKKDEQLAKEWFAKGAERRE